MYARYIPPPKEKSSTPQNTSSAPYSRHVRAVRPVSPPRVSPEPIVPLGKRTVFGDDDFPSPNAKGGPSRWDDELTGAQEEPRKSKDADKNGQEGSPKREVKGRKVKHPNPQWRRDEEKDNAKSGNKGRIAPPYFTDSEADTEAEAETSTQSREIAEGVAPDAATDEPKPKKPKREKKKRGKEGDLGAAEDGDSVRARHKTVFEMVEKALSLRPRTPPTDAMDVDGGAGVKELETEEVHGLEPLPQPESVVLDESKLTYETLPPWLASPIRVTNDSKRPFSELGIAPESAKLLEKKGFGSAFAVQTAVLPLLLPSAGRQGDVVVAAPTGSGKTLAYVLPMVRDISQGVVTRLRGIIVLPTRELVHQVQQACEDCVAAFAIDDAKRVKIGTAAGNKVFKEEQASMMKEEQRYDPAGYEANRRKQWENDGLEGPEDDDPGLGRDKSEILPHHVITHVSRVDILICTPGRLIEHIRKTPGFTLDYVRWLVVDEADKLLAQDFQQWLDVVMKALSTDIPSARDFPRTNKKGPRKVILSATMTKDISLLNQLKLSRPRLVVLEGTKAGELALPASLRESAIKIRDPSFKPLYLVDLLNSGLLVDLNLGAADTTEDKMSVSSSGGDGAESDSDSDSESSERSSGSESSASDSDSSSGSDDIARRTAVAKPQKIMRPDASVLIFTKSNEAALRLSHLLGLLTPDLAPLIGTLTSSTRTSKRAQTLRAYARGKLRILVASDLVSRGIDLFELDHVINYDLPISETSYVHRVGRTARAGRVGHAWTLLEYAEARRFWRDFAGEGKGATTNIIRTNKVERVRLCEEEETGGQFSEERIKLYEEALEQLGRETSGKR